MPVSRKKKPAFWEGRNRRRILPAFLMVGIVGGLYFFVSQVISSVLLLGNAMASHGKGSGTFLILGMTILFQGLFFVGLTLFLFKNWHRRPVADYFRIRPAPIHLILASAVGIVVLIPFFSAVSEFFLRLFPVLKDLRLSEGGLLQAKKPWEWVFMIVAIGVTPAVCEEFLFRGYFQRTLERGLRTPTLYIVSGTIFALIHQNYFGLIQLTLVGIYLGFVYHRAGSLFASSAAHFAYNTTLVILVNTPQTYWTWLENAKGETSAKAALASAALGLALIVFIRRFSKVPETE